jgi:hypothetical protein
MRLDPDLAATVPGSEIDATADLIPFPLKVLGQLSYPFHSLGPPIYFVIVLPSPISFWNGPDTSDSMSSFLYGR